MKESLQASLSFLVRGWEARMSNASLVFWSVLNTSFIAPFMSSSVNLAIPSIGEQYGVAPGSLSWVVSAFLLGSVAVLLPMGKLADIVGRKKFYTIGVVVLLVCMIVAGVSASLEMLIASRLLQGMATAMLFGTGMAMLISVHPPEERGKAIGYSAAATYIGLSLGPILGGLITHYLGWHSLFFLSAAVLLISLLLILRVHEEWYGAKGERLDLVGSGCYMIASPAILYGFSSLMSNPYAKYALVGGLALLGVFIRQQLRSKSPLVDLRLFRTNTVFAMSNIAAMINYSATFAIGFVLSLYLQLIRGFDEPTAGMVLLIQPVIMALFSPKAGALSDRLQPRLVASIGMGLNTVGLLLFAFLDASTPVWMIGINLVVIGLGFALFSSPNNNAIMGSVSPPEYSVAASVLATMRQIGQAMSMAIVTFLISVYAADVLSPEYLIHLMEGFHATFGAFSVLCAVGVLASLARGKRIV